MTLKVGDVVELKCDNHRPRRRRRVAEIDKAIGVRFDVLAEDLCDCRLCDPFRESGLRSGWFGLGVRLVGEPETAEAQGLLW